MLDTPVEEIGERYAQLVVTEIVEKRVVDIRRRARPPGPPHPRPRVARCHRGCGPGVGVARRLPPAVLDRVRQRGRPRGGGDFSGRAADSSSVRPSGSNPTCPTTIRPAGAAGPCNRPDRVGVPGAMSAPSIGKADGQRPWMPSSTKDRLHEAARAATLRYPGAVGELLHQELLSWMVFGHQLGSGLIMRLAAELLTDDGNTAAPAGEAGRRSRRRPRQPLTPPRRRRAPAAVPLTPLRP